MTRISSVLRAGPITVLALVSSGDIARAAEQKVLASVALPPALGELAPMYEHATGDKLSIGYGLAANLKKRVLDGEAADVIILTRPMMDELQKRDKLGTNSLVNVAGTQVSVVARAGAPKPDVSSVDAFKGEAAKALVWFLTGPEATSSFKMKGFEPG